MLNNSRMNLETDRTDLKHAEAPRNLATKRKETHRIHLSVYSISTFVCVNFHVFMMIFCYFLTSRSTETARQNKFRLIYIVELSKPYRIVIKSWKSVQAKQIIPLFTRVYFFRVCETHAAKQLPQSSWTCLSYKLNTTRQQKSCSFC